MTGLFLAAFALGLIFNAAPGAVFAETARQAVRGGFRPALYVQVGSLVGDALWAVLGLAGVGLLFRLDFLRIPVGVAGIAYLLWLAYDAWRASSTNLDPPGAGAHTSAWRAGVLLSVTNPQNIAYWAALGSAMGTAGVHDPSALHYLSFLGGFMTSSIVWSFACAAVLARLFLRSTTRWAHWTYRLCAAAFLALALASLRDLLQDQRPVTPAVPPTNVTAP